MLNSFIFVLCMITYLMIGHLLLPVVIAFMVNHQVTAPNYEKRLIPIGLGVFLWVMLMIYFVLLRGLDLLGIIPMNPNMYVYVIALTSIFIIGWLDDTIGDKQVKGIAGHWRKWKHEGVLTTGLLKAGTTCVLALWIVLELKFSVYIGIAQFLLIVFMTNALNLLDLRPGRSLKGFFLVVLLWTAVTFIFSLKESSFYYLLPVVIGALLLFPLDLQGKIMLGDTGANYLGFALGFSIAVSSPLWFQSMMIILLIWLHYIAAQSSITSKIESSHMLRWLDRMGRI